MTEIRELVSRRSDLSTFVVHLTREHDSQSAKDQLKAIVTGGTIEARSPFGHAVKSLRDAGQSTESQKCVCFTETPLEYLHLLVEEIENRQFKFEPYGIAITKKLARMGDVNPVWYLNQNIGKDWVLVNAVNTLVDAAIRNHVGRIEDEDILKLTPFVEQMCPGGRTVNGRHVTRKEFWWEREWRHCGDFSLPEKVIVICPEKDHDDLRATLDVKKRVAKLLDASWGLEQIIARLAGFEANDIEIL